MGGALLTGGMGGRTSSDKRGDMRERKGGKIRRRGWRRTPDAGRRVSFLFNEGIGKEREGPGEVSWLFWRAECVWNGILHWGDRWRMVL